MISAEPLKAPFPYFGGKSRIASEVWARFGDTLNFVEPFFGSGAVLLGRPPWPHVQNRIETVNDADGFVSNFWRATQADPEAVAHHADWPVNENDLHARHAWLVGQHEALQAQLEGDPDYCDAKIAGWWAWGMSCWIGGGFCSGAGPWHVVDGLLVNVKDGDAGQGVNRQLPQLRNAGEGVARSTNTNMLSYMARLSLRIKRVRVCCGDWSRICTPSVTFTHGITAVFLDPPYSAEAGRDGTLYRVESATVAHAVREWALANGDSPLMRIALCGYGSEHDMPDSWEALSWKTGGGYGSQGNGTGRANSSREMVWFSPHCLKPDGELF